MVFVQNCYTVTHTDPCPGHRKNTLRATNPKTNKAHYFSLEIIEVM